MTLLLLLLLLLLELQCHSVHARRSRHPVLMDVGAERETAR